MISINGTLAVQVIHFLLMVYILNRIMLRPLMRQVHERENHMKQGKVDAEEMVAEAERLVEKRLSMETDARRKAARERARLIEGATASAEDIFDETRKQTGDIRDRMNARIQEQMENAQKTLEREATALADEIVERITGRRVSY